MSLARSMVARLAAGALAACAITACTERLVTPGDCPDLCPNAYLPVIDTVLTATVGADSSYAGYIPRGANTAILVTTDGFAAQNSRGFYQFLRRSDSVLVNDTLRPYTIDSVAILLGVVGRDSAVKNLQVGIYKLDSTADTSLTFAELDAALVPGALIASAAVPDSIRSGTVRVVLAGDDLARVALTPADSGVLRVGLDLAAGTPTGIRLGALSGGQLSTFFLTYVTSIVADTVVRTTITRGISATTYASEAPDPAPGPGRLVVGGAPSVRTLVRFDLPEFIRDSVTIVRARLELDPIEPIRGLPNDDAAIDATGVLIDVGAKSPLVTGLVFSDTLQAGQTAPIEIEVRRIVASWQIGTKRPPAIFLSMNPEASTFTLPLLASTADPARAPRIRIAYVRRYPFQNP